MGGDAQVLQVGQPLLCGAVGALRGEGADVQFVEHAVGQCQAAAIRCCCQVYVRSGSIHLGLAVHAVRQKAGVGIGQ